ncbi:MAG: glycosyltransferase family 2 protein [Chthoniobacterales bacterium]
MSTISIIIPAYNAASFLPAAIRSCLNQILAPCQIIVVDDGSDDETGKAAQFFGNTIEYIRIENRGVSRARNVGAAQARGEWLVFLDADDQLLPHALESLLQVALEKKAGVAYGMVIERREQPQLARLNGFDYAAGVPPHGGKRNFWRSAIITPGSAIVKASLHERIGGFVSGYEPMEDRDYWIKCGLMEPMAFCDTVILDKMWRPSSHGSQDSKRIYRGQKALRALKTWACDRQIGVDWMPDDQKIIRSALDEAIWRRHYDILSSLLKEAKTVQLFHWKAILLSMLFRIF